MDHLIREVRTSGRTLRLQILPDRTILVIAPHDVDIEPFIREKRGWIEKKLRELTHIEEHYGKFDDMFLLDGCFHSVTCAPACSLPRSNSGVVTYDTPGHLKQLLTTSLRTELEEKVLRFSTHCGMKPHGICIRTQRTKWGSCSGHGMLNFNLALLALPPPVRDYVIFHEVVHLRERNHSPTFRDILASYWPEYKAHEHLLKTYWLLVERNSIWKVLRSL
ncbi:MAG: M48 family metallopeptidase [Methanomicrobiales archaeon]|nr:M48 family metallopeptidase [Methanomicrobiales archaeon]